MPRWVVGMRSAMLITAPRARDAGQGGVQTVQCVCCEGVIDPPAASARGDQAGLAQHLEVVAEQISGDRHLLLQVAHTGFAAGQVLQQSPPNRIRHDREQLRALQLGCHLSRDCTSHT